MKGTLPNWLRVVALVALLLGERVWLLYRFPEESGAVTGVLVLFWGHILAGFAVYLGIARVARGAAFKSLSGLELQRSLAPLGFHLVYFQWLLWLLPRWDMVGMGQGPGPWHQYTQMVFWYLILIGFFLSWIACLVPIRYWPRMLRQDGHVLVGGAVMSGVAWGLGKVTMYVWSHLAHVTFFLVLGLLNRLGVPAQAATTDLGLFTPTFACTIANACSGVEGIALIAAAISAYLWLGRNHLAFPRALLLLPLGMVIIFLTNVVRLTLLVIIGSYLSPYIAVSGFHSNFGWLMFALVSVILVFCSEKLGWFSAHTESTPAPVVVRREYPSAAYLAPFLTLLFMMLVCNTFALKFDDTYPLRMLVLLVPLWIYRRKYRSWPFSISGAAVGAGLLVFVIWLVLEPASEPVDSPFAVLPFGMAVGWLVVRLLGSSLLIPLTEELAFKGFLLRRLVSPDFDEVPLTRYTTLSFLGSTVAFGLMHQRFAAACIAGSMYTLLLYRRGNLWDAVQAHAVTNFCLGVYAICFGQWSLWI